MPLFVSAALFLMMMFASTVARAGGESAPLRYAVFDSMGYPFNITSDADHQSISGGLLTEFGQQLGREMGASITVVPLARRRMEPALQAGEVDFVCYFSPQWSDAPAKLRWSVPGLSQVERVVARKGTALTGDVRRDFVDRGVATRIGFHYPAIESLVAKGKTRRLDEASVPLMFKNLRHGMADVLIASEGEIVGFFKAEPDARKELVVSDAVFSVTQTQCAIAPNSALTTERLNKALTTLAANGEMNRLAQRYGLSKR
jgi:polar amino acid transport system substrate-binding protein